MFHPLTIKEIRRETPECVSISFDIPEHLKEQYRFEPGQNVTLKLNLGDEEIRRSYSICSSPGENELRVAVKQIAGGRFSEHANSFLKVGDVVNVLPPTGKFNTKLISTNAKHYLAFAAGSGITPVI
jgi:ring-1,2-phenylacetyl-CoA epoxidase subunit PaaE